MNIKNKKMPLRNLVVSLIMLLLLAITLSFGGITFAWFYKGTDNVPADTLRGSIHAAYFNGGIGAEPSENATYKEKGSTYPAYSVGGEWSQLGPYQIDNITQLYNFAWLQYLGYFNNENAPYYFVLTNHIDASSIVLPPIGTTDNPFVGYFDGNGYQISGLRVSNNPSELQNDNVGNNKFNIPESALNDGMLSDSAEIVGFFGVVGEMDGDYSSEIFVPTVRNVKLSGTNIKTQTTNSLAGIAAGYVNGIMEDVIVTGTSVIRNSASTPLSYTNNLSDYALVGFCEEPYRKVLSVETVNVYEPKIETGSNGRLGEDNQGQAWGNSIDMKSMYERLDGIYDGIQSTEPLSYVSAKTIVHHNGTSSITSTEIATATVSMGSGYSLKTTKTLVNDSEIASYALIEQDRTHDYVYLYGDKEIAAPTVTITDVYNEDAFYIQYGSNYLTNVPDNTTDTNSASKWVFEPSNNGYKIYTISGDNKQYLYKNNSNNLAVGSSGSDWTVTTDQIGTSISTGGYYLCFSHGVWKLLPPPQNYITDSTETHYLSISNGNIVDCPVSANATPWNKETVAGGYILYAEIDNTTYYLKADSGYTISLTQNAAEASVWKEITGTATDKPKIYVDLDDNNGKALYYDGSVWKLVDYTIGGTGNDWGGSMNFKQMNQTIFDLTPSINNKTGLQQWSVGDMYLSMTKSGTTNPSGNTVIFRYRDGSYIPINMNENAVADNGNTGYIVGCSVSGSSSNAAVRSASYPINKIKNSLGTTDTVSYSNDKIEVLTFYNNSWVRIKDSYNENNSSVASVMPNTRKTVAELGFDKYENAREALHEKILKDSSYINGIHMDNVLINESEKITISNAKILGNTKSSYSVPKACINFNLKEAGRINFFAGSYYNEVNADSFFSLHHVFRTNDTTFSIKEISVIYNNTNSSNNEDYPYVYEYTDNSYSVGTAGTPVFDMSVLKNAPGVANALYYFEIPVNSGEYAIGAVKSGNAAKSQGAYLLYLDISANATIEGDSKLLEGEAVNPVVKSSAGTISYSTNSTETVSIKTPPTYFPLAFDDAGSDVSNANTGYVISGANYTAGSPPGDVRVSRYFKEDVSGDYYGIRKSLTNGNLDDIKMYTYDTNGNRMTISKYGVEHFYKYITSKNQLQEVLDADNDNYVYGLHFMDAQISTSNLVTVPNATINGRTYSDYQMPRDSIDFTLSTPGYINVFAGTYFSGSSVNCFFSLYKIERDANKNITAINEIEAIYEDNGSYNYQYTGGTVPSGTKVFDTTCLTSPSGLESDSVYYFEIPAGTGEFAIGSVSGKNGGYLLYLDISTHQGDSVEVHEKMTIDTATYILPIGVEFEGTANTVFEVPIDTTGNITFIDTVTDVTGTVTATHSLIPTVSNSGKIIQTVTITDSVGSFSAKKISEGTNVTYYYREGNDEYDEVTNQADKLSVERYFDVSMNNSILTYIYSVEGNNTVSNGSGSVVYSSGTGFTIISYPITAEASNEAVTATIQNVDANKSYIELNGRNNLQTSQNVQIPVRVLTPVP